MRSSDVIQRGQSDAQHIGIGLIGYGGIGRLHALVIRMVPLMYPGLPGIPRLVAVATASDASAARAQRELGDGVACGTSIDALLANPAVTLVDCCAPTGAHGWIGDAVLASRRDLFMEKPLTADPAESARLVAQAAAQGVRAGVNYHNRHVPAIQQLRQHVASGALGTVRSVHMRYYRASNLRGDRPVSWRTAGAGSGVLIDLGSHLLDLVEYLLGPIRRISARLRTVVAQRPDASGALVPVTADDIAWLTIELDDGAYGTIEVSKVVPGAGDEIVIEAYGALGSCRYDSRDPNSLELATGGAAATTLRRVTASRVQPAAALPSPEMPTGVLQWHAAALADLIAGGTTTASLAAGLAVDRALAAARYSAAHGGIAVELAAFAGDQEAADAAR
ncbi:MAG: Gfo/Idh/MocA family oxidoreductase [Chloroflexi bacterium]|nr:Gfo/Idh/MocA family oxidoreductase [Chloroflexota bacterium]